MTSGYWYLGQSYSRYPHGHDAAFMLACWSTALLLRSGVSVFSPIVHSHPLVEHGGLNAVDHDFWINTVDRPLMEGAKGLIFLETEGWANSAGLHEEIVEFVKAGKPVVFMRPGEVPEELLRGYPHELEEEPSDGYVYSQVSKRMTAAEDDAFWDGVFAKHRPPEAPPPDPVMSAYTALLKATGNDHTAVIEFNILVDDGMDPFQASRIAAEDWAKRTPKR